MDKPWWHKVVEDAMDEVMIANHKKHKAIFNEESKMDKEFRRWYDAKEGTKSESFAYDVWVAAWEAATWEATKPKMCICETVQRCNTFDRCMKNEL